MSSLNKAMVIGRLGKDPELKYTQSGTAVCTMSLATDESYKDKQGNRVDQTEWHRIVVWDKQAENCAQYLAKGRLVYVEGKLQTRKWQDQQGQDRYTTEIVAQRVQFLESKSSGGGVPHPAEQPPAQPNTNAAGFPTDQSAQTDDVPF